MKISKLLLLIIGVVLFNFCTSNQGFETKQLTDSNGYKYTAVTNDPYGLRIYTLDNGLKAFLSVNKDEPRIQSFIPIKAGSTYDPADNTGLAHYLEHMMFKGSPSIGTVNWEKEEPLLKQISDLYEKHKAEQDPAKKKAIYAEIDRVSEEAVQYVAPNEYDGLIQSLGGKYTNAYTTNERTVFMNNIPSNELDKWLQLESERFFNPVLRVFHTELETVYEEFNMGQDRDGTKTYQSLFANLFPTHPYGQQTTIGVGEHLKNPSMENILKYQHTYYVPNNMAICLSGDLDQEKTIQLIDKYFGQQASKEVPEKALPIEAPITEKISVDVLGPQAEFVYLGFRFDGIGSEDEKMVHLIDYMLNNTSAGLMDLNLNQQQKVLRAGCGPNFMKEYGVHIFYGNPRQGQTLEEVEDLMLGEIEKIKNGEFEDWLIEASVNNLKLDQVKNMESNNRAHTFAVNFANGVSWESYLEFIDSMKDITKEQVMTFAKERYTKNYVAVYKRQGEDPNVMKIEKPEITPVELNRENKSEFAKNLESQESNRMEPVFINYEEKINTQEFAKGVQFSYIKNPTNQLFKLIYIVDMGKDHNKELALAVNYLPYLGTDKYSPAELKQEFFKYGLNFGVSTGADRSYVSISGLEDNAEKAMELMEHLLANVVPAQESFDKYVEGITKSRADKKLDKDQIRSALMSYGKYGEKSSYTDIIQTEEMSKIDPNALTDLIKQITSYEHQLFYYGQKQENEAFSLLKQYHLLPESLKPVEEPTKYAEKAIDKTEVYFVDYDMVQTQFVILSKDVALDNNLAPQIRLFNEFYGLGLSSIVFQEIRESRALAYSAYSYFTTPRRMGESHYNYAYVATQVDKFKMAAEAMEELLSEMPKAENQFETSKDAIMKKIETERIIKDAIFWSYVNAKDVGLDYDIRKDVYEYMQTASMDDFKGFFDAHIANKEAVYLVIGKKESIDFKALKAIGPIKELSLEEVFNY